VAARGEGIDTLLTAIEAHHAEQLASGALAARRRRRLEERTREVVERSARRWVWQETRADSIIRARLDQLATGELSPYAVASEILEELKEGSRT
jgi:LAO/AO transport system kinase